jgi:hypothetical protein
MSLRTIARPRLRSAAVVAAIVALAAALSAAGCGTTTAPAGGGPAPTLIVIHDKANGSVVSARAGDRVELILASSYWKVAGSSSPSVLRQDGPAALMARPSNCPNIPGLGCIPVRVTFTARAGGKAVITASRSACGEAMPCMPDQTRFTVTVVVS